jgi:ADP-ribose pyrophosphatase YjhB (NUDIX family)
MEQQLIQLADVKSVGELEQFDDSGESHSVTGIIFDRNGSSCLVRQTATRKSSPPSGGVNAGEEEEIALTREIEEEMGLDASNIKSMKLLYVVQRTVKSPFFPEDRMIKKIHVFYVILNCSLRESIPATFKSADGEIDRVDIIPFVNDEYILPQEFEASSKLRFIFDDFKNIINPTRENTRYFSKVINIRGGMTKLWFEKAYKFLDTFSPKSQ